MQGQVVGVTWFKVDDTLAFHAKVVAAGNEAMGLWVRAGSWSSQQLTDGFIPDHMIAAMGGGEDRLVEVGLWTREDGGCRFHEWEQAQFTRAEIEAKREAERDRKRKQRRTPGGQFTDSGRSPGGVPAGHPAGQDAESPRESHRPVPTRPDPSRPTSPNGEGTVAVRDPARKRATRIPEGFTPSPEVIEAMRAECPRVDLEAENRKFVDYWSAKAGKDATKLDWDATWRNWIRRAKDSNVAQFPARQSASERAQAHLDTVAEAERLMGLR